MRQTIINKIDLNKLSDEKLLELYDLTHGNAQLDDVPLKELSMDPWANFPWNNEPEESNDTIIAPECKTDKFFLGIKEFDGGIYNQFLVDKRQDTNYRDVCFNMHTSAAVKNDGEHLIRFSDLSYICDKIIDKDGNLSILEFDKPYWLYYYWDSKNNTMYNSFEIGILNGKWYLKFKLLNDTTNTNVGLVKLRYENMSL